MTVDNQATEEASETMPKKKAAPALKYGDHVASAKPKLVDHLPTAVRNGGGSQGASDIRAAFIEIEKHRGKWFLVAEAIPNAGRFYDGFRSQGALVKVQRTDKKMTVKTRTGEDVEVPTFDVYAAVPEGEIKRWLKGKKKKEAEAAAAAEAEAAEHGPAARQNRGSS